MNQKKTVIFHLCNNEQYYGEFNIHTQIKILKSYFKDISHVPKFKLLYNGQVLEEEKRILDYSHNKMVFFIKVSVQNVVNLNNSVGQIDHDMSQMSHADFTPSKNLHTINSAPNIIYHATTEDLIKENYSLANKGKDYEAQITSLQKENTSLVSIIEELNEKLLMLQRRNETTQSQNLLLNKNFETLKVDYNNLELLYIQTREKLEKFQQLSANNFSNRKVSVSTSFEGSKRKSSLASSGGMSKMKDYMKSVVLNNIVDAPQAHVKRDSNRKSKFLSSSVPKKGFENGGGGFLSNIINAVNKDKDDTSNTNNNYSVESLKLKNKNLAQFKYIKTKKTSTWNGVLTFLNPVDQANLSLANKTYFHNVYTYLFDLTSSKLENINLALQLNFKKYETVLEEQQFTLSPSTNSALKILSNAKYLEIFSYDNSYFTQEILPVYRILFQLTKISLEISKIPDEEFINNIKIYFIENTKKLNLGDLLKNLPKNCDFSSENVEKIEELMNQYNIKNIDCGPLGKICKTTGIIAFFVKDAMVFCGLDNSQDKKLNAKDKDRIQIIKDNIEIKNIKKKNESILSSVSDQIKKYELSFL